MAQNIIYSPWEGTKCPWLCLMTTPLLFSVLWLFSFVSAFLISLIKLILWPKLSTDKRQAEDTVGARTVGSCSVSLELWGPWTLSHGLQERGWDVQRDWEGSANAEKPRFMVLWNPELRNTLRRTLKTVEYSLLCQRVQGESVLNKDLDISERPSFLPSFQWSYRDVRVGL